MISTCRSSCAALKSGLCGWQRSRPKIASGEKTNLCAASAAEETDTPLVRLRVRYLGTHGREGPASRLKLAFNLRERDIGIITLTPRRRAQAGWEGLVGQSLRRFPY